MTFAHLTLATRDVVATRDFFAAVLGWKVIHHADNIERDAIWMEIAPGQQLHLLRVDDFEPSSYEAEYGRHVALFFPGGEFDQMKERLRRHGAELIDPSRPTPFERFFFRDPNGYVFEIVDQDAFVVE
jgi:catechol 2,3-dioxygenase-like lactoylglutathione lyase family enzyme